MASGHARAPTQCRQATPFGVVAPAAPGGDNRRLRYNRGNPGMTRLLTVAIGARSSVALARHPLADAIHQGLEHRTPRAPRAGALVASALALSLLPAMATQAAIITVDSAGPVVNGDGLCQLQEAVDNANVGGLDQSDCDPGEPGLDTIVFDPQLANSVITLDNTLTLFDALSIDGAAAESLVIE